MGSEGVDRIDPAVRAEIEGRLDGIEEREGVRVLYACESGSRAWGFASKDSDWDVRFLYLHPRDWYLSIDERRDVVELPIEDDLDVSGWDLRKALRLFRKSNPPLLEWLGSPLVYRERGTVASSLRRLAATYASPVACASHYLHMARGNFREYLQGPEVWRKKYLYVLRPILAVRWIERGLGLVPTEFQVLVDRVVDDRELREAIDRFLVEKRAGAELDRGPRNEALSAFIEGELPRLEAVHLGRCAPRAPVAELDELFRAAIEETFGA